jgi:hypothetical protein
VRTAILITLGAAIAIAASAGCAKVAMPPQVTVSEIEPSGRAAKPPDCDMPVLRAEPLDDYRKVDIIEGVGSRWESEADVLPAVKRKACETGADAIVITGSKSQTTEAIVGYYVGAYAIVYGKRNPSTVEGGVTSYH